MVIASITAGLVATTALAAAVSSVSGSVADLKADAVESARERDALFAQLEEEGLRPVVTPDNESLAEPDQLGERGVRAIVAEELAQQDLRLTAVQVDQIARVAAAGVPPGEDGESPSDEEVRAVVQDVVAAVCADDACRGPAGTDAPPVTDAQITARVEAYCAAHNGCRGPAGDSVKGDKGDKGDPGPSCPENYTLVGREVDHDENPLTDPEKWFVCVTDAPPETQGAR